jgi:hypothetical protein
MTLSINDTQHNQLSALCRLSSCLMSRYIYIYIYIYAEFHYAECRYAVSWRPTEGCEKINEKQNDPGFDPSPGKLSCGGIRTLDLRNQS